MLIINKDELFCAFHFQSRFNCITRLYWFGSFHTCQTNSTSLKVT